GTVTINVQPTPPPTGIDDYYVGNGFAPLSVPAPGVLANDINPGPTPGTSGGTLTAEKLTDPQYGAVTLNPDGSFLYTPSSGFPGLDTFTYRPVSAGGGPGHGATVYITDGVKTPKPLLFVRVTVDGTPYLLAQTHLHDDPDWYNGYKP